VAYAVLTQDDLTKWWITGTGTAENTLSEVMDDAPDGPAIYHLDADNDWTDDSAPEWYVATATKPDNVSENLAGWRNMTDAGDDQMGSLNADEWTYDTGNNRVYIRLSDDSDPNATDVRCDYDWDGAGDGPAFMTEHVDGGIYQIHLLFELGDGSTSTTLSSINECVWFDTDVNFLVTAQATLNLGQADDVDGSWAMHPTAWFTDADATLDWLPANATLNMYGTLWKCKSTNGYYRTQAGTSTIKNSLIFGNAEDTGNSTDGQFELKGATFTLKDVFMSNMRKVASAAALDLEDVRFNKIYQGFQPGSKRYVIVGTDILIANCESLYFGNSTATSTVVLLNPKEAVVKANVSLGNATACAKIAYTVNIHVADKDGANLQSASVLIQDQFGNIVSYSDSGETTGEIVGYTEWDNVAVSDGSVFSVDDILLIQYGFEKVLVVDGNNLDFTNSGGNRTPGYSQYIIEEHPTSSTIYNVGTVATGADGKIPELIVQALQWYSTAETETVYSPHKFTISKAGYETLVLENITIDSKIDWHLELQPVLAKDYKGNLYRKLGPTQFLKVA